MLLLHVKGAKSFADLKTFHNVTYPSFLEAAKAIELVATDDEWDECLEESVDLQFPHS